jgi:hypothetical protein
LCSYTVLLNNLRLHMYIILAIHLYRICKEGLYVPTKLESKWFLSQNRWRKLNVMHIFSGIRRHGMKIKLWPRVWQHQRKEGKFGANLFLKVTGKKSTNTVWKKIPSKLLIERKHFFPRGKSFLQFMKRCVGLDSFCLGCAWAS